MSSVSKSGTAQNTHATTSKSQDSPSTVPVKKNNFKSYPLPFGFETNNREITGVILRGICGAIACSVYIVGQRKVFNQHLTINDLVTVSSTCGFKGSITQVKKLVIRKMFEKSDQQTEDAMGQKTEDAMDQKTEDAIKQKRKDAMETVFVSVLEAGINIFQEKATAKNLSYPEIFMWGTIKGLPNNFMDTQSYSNLIQWSKDKVGLKDETFSGLKERINKESEDLENNNYSPSMYTKARKFINREPEESKEFNDKFMEWLEKKKDSDNQTIPQLFKDLEEEYDAKIKNDEFVSDEEKIFIKKLSSENSKGSSDIMVKMFWNNIAALITVYPGNILNNEPVTRTNFGKTYGLRLVSISLWRAAMDIAESGAKRLVPDTKKVES